MEKLPMSAEELNRFEEEAFELAEVPNPKERPNKNIGQADSKVESKSFV